VATSPKKSTTTSSPHARGQATWARQGALVEIWTEGSLDPLVSTEGIEREGTGHA